MGVTASKTVVVDELFLVSECQASMQLKKASLRIDYLQHQPLDQAIYKKGIFLDIDFILNLLQDKRAALQALQKDQTSKTLRKILQEAKQAALIREKKIFSTPAAGYVFLTAEAVHELIKNGYRFFRGVIISGDCDLSDIPSLQKIDFGNAIFGGVLNLTGCNISNANFQGAVFRKEVISTQTDIRGANFKDAEFEADWKVDEKTIRDTRTRKLGFLGNRYQTNIETRAKSLTFLINQYPITLVFQDNEKLKIDKIFINNISCDVEKWWSFFVIQYQEICHADFFRRFRGNFLDRLSSRLLAPAEKIHLALIHAHREPGNRTYRALVKTLAKIKPDTQAVSPISFEGSQLVASPKTETKKENHIGWKQKSLSTLFKASFVEKSVASPVKKIEPAPPQKITVVERQYYLAELIKQKKWAEAKKETKILFEENPTIKLIDTPFFMAITSLKKEYAEKVCKIYDEMVYDSKESLMTLFSVQHDHIMENLREISDLSGGEFLTHAHNFLCFGTLVKNGLEITVALEEMIYCNLVDKPFSEIHLKRVFSLTHYASLVWVGSASQKNALIEKMQSKIIMSDSTKAMRLTVLSGLVQKIPLCEDFRQKPYEMTEGDLRALSCSVFLFNEAFSRIKQAFYAVWSYLPIQAAIKKQGNYFIFDKLSVAYTKIKNKSDIIAFEKAAELYQLVNQLEEKMTTFSFSFQDNSNAALLDLLEDKNLRDVRSLLGYDEMINGFMRLESKLREIHLALRHEKAGLYRQENPFGQYISNAHPQSPGALEKLLTEREQWEKVVSKHILFYEKRQSKQDERPALHLS